jgi:dienelactone hydrolase
MLLFILNGAFKGESKVAEIVLFHHALGLTAGVTAFADDLRRAGHTVHTPDLFEGRVFADLEQGMRFVHELGFDEVIRRGERAVQDLSQDLVYSGFSLGVVPAQKLAQTRPGARGALFFYACVPVSEFGQAWPAQLPVQVHGMDADPFFVGEGDIDAARELIAQAAHGELFLYSGDQHYFADSSLPSYHAEATALLLKRVLKFLASIEFGEGTK